LTGSVSTAARDKFAEEQSETAKMTQASILRKRAADALAAQRKLMQVSEAQWDIQLGGGFEGDLVTLDAGFDSTRARVIPTARSCKSKKRVSQHLTRR
jgi:hypothetical protein